MSSYCNPVRPAKSSLKAVAYPSESLNAINCLYKTRGQNYTFNGLILYYFDGKIIKKILIKLLLAYKYDHEERQITENLGRASRDF